MKELKLDLLALTRMVEAYALSTEHLEWKMKQLASKAQSRLKAELHGKDLEIEHTQLKLGNDRSNGGAPKMNKRKEESTWRIKTYTRYSSNFCQPSQKDQRKKLLSKVHVDSKLGYPCVMS